MERRKFKLFILILALLSILITSPDVGDVYANSLNLPATVQSKGDVAYSGLITTRKQLVNAFIKHVKNLDTNFTLKISYKAISNNQTALRGLWHDFNKHPDFNEIMEHAKIRNSVTYNYSSYFLLKMDMKYNISKKQAKKLLKKVTPIIKSKKQLIKVMRKHVERLDKNFYINIDRKVLNINNKKQYDAFWNELYDIPEFNDVSRYFKNFKSYQHGYSSYYKWIVKTKYSISKKELNYTKNFVKNWVKENINSGMSEEAKVRAINDFMVDNYRYTYGDKGQSPKTGKKRFEEKLGKYSVHSCFSLLYGGGGVCDAKSKLFYRLAKEAGLKVIFITGYVNGNTLHAWNMVKVDGNWYHLDNTWNRATRIGMTENEYFNSRDYYLKSDATMRKEYHTWKAGKYPKADFDYPLTEG